MLEVRRVKRAYKRALLKVGAPIDLLVNNGAGFDEYPSVPAMVRGFSLDELVGDVQLGDVKVLILADDLPEGVKLRSRRDRLRINGEVYGVIVADPNTRAIAGQTIAWEIQARG
ncbi:hypothetical protein LCM08_06195 [Salipiger pacificus]|nr:hypothetical protein [Alloyangia pacifica]